MSGNSAALRRVVYVSHAIERPAVPHDRLLEEILATARRNNARLGVTGALVYSARRFAQVLEGPPEAVEQIFETIQCDLRHDHVTVLEVADVTERAFGAWSMAFVEDAGAALVAADQPGGATRLVSILKAAIRNTEAATA